MKIIIFLSVIFLTTIVVNSQNKLKEKIYGTWQVVGYSETVEFIFSDNGQGVFVWRTPRMYIPFSYTTKSFKTFDQIDINLTSYLPEWYNQRLGIFTIKDDSLIMMITMSLDKDDINIKLKKRPKYINREAAIIMVRSEKYISDKFELTNKIALSTIYNLLSKGEKLPDNCCPPAILVEFFGLFRSSNDEIIATATIQHNDGPMTGAFIFRRTSDDSWAIVQVNFSGPGWWRQKVYEKVVQ